MGFNSPPRSTCSGIAVVGGGLLVGMVIVALLFRSLLGRPLATTVWGDNFDPRLIHWILEWGYQALWSHREQFSLWDANSFYPHTGSLAFSDSLLTLQLFYLPLRILGLPALTACYATLTAVVVFGCVSSAYLFSRLSHFTFGELVVMVFLAHGSLSVSNYAGHYQLLGIHFAVPALLGVLNYIRVPERGALILTLLLGAAAVMCATYLAPMLASLLLIGSLWLVAMARLELRHWWRLHREALSAREIAIQGAIVSVAIAIVAVVQFAPYLAVFGGEERDFIEHLRYSARPWSLFLHISPNSYWWGGLAKAAWTEYAYAPGLATTLLLCLGVGGWWKRGGPDGRCSERGVVDQLVPFGLFLIITSVILSLGPRWSDSSRILLPFGWLAELLPGLAQVRTPGRFGLFVGLGAALLAPAGLRTVRGWHRSAPLVIAILIMVESAPSFPAYRSGWREVPIYRDTRAVIAPRTPLIELPVAGRDPLGTLVRILAQLHGGLTHGGWLVSGYGGRTTPELDELLILDRAIQRGEKPPRVILPFAQRIGVHYLIIHVRHYRPGVAKRWGQMVKRNPLLRIVARRKGSVLIEVKREG